MTEIWKDIEGYEGRYQVSNIGRVKSLNYKRLGAEKILRLSENGRGYLKINLCMNGEVELNYVHRLVCEAFLSNPENNITIKHINGNKIDNRLDNLEWINIYDNRILSKCNKSYKRQKHVLMYSKSGQYICEFSGAGEAQRYTDIDDGYIIICCRGKLKSAGGYIWKYKNNN